MRKIIIFIFLLFSLVVLAVGLKLKSYDMLTQMDLIKTYGLTLKTLYSHRGLNSVDNKIGTLEGENSVPSFELAGKNGYQYLETDIYETKDGKFYCIHDDTTGSYSSQELLVTQATSDRVNQVKLDKIIKNASVSKEFQDKVYNIPTLETYLEICKKYNMMPLIEIKTLQNNTTSVDNLIKIAESYTNKFIIFSFNLSYVLRAKKYNKNLLVSYLTPYEDSITKDIVDLYASKGIGVAPYIKRIDKNVCEYAYNKGYPVIIWSIDDKEQYLNEYKNWKVWMFGTNSIKPNEL